jgi:hypothetical protein
MNKRVWQTYAYLADCVCEDILRLWTLGLLRLHASTGHFTLKPVQGR